MITQTLPAPKPVTSKPQSPSFYKIFFLCEDGAAREKAQVLRNKLAGNCQGHVVLEAGFCTFAQLCHPELRAAARLGIEEADMFILSAHGTNGLPMFVQKWLNEFSPHKKPMACAEFFQPGISEPFAHHFMERWSQKLGTEFFSNCYLPNHTNARPQLAAC